jgi:hypothetical protein
MKARSILCLILLGTLLSTASSCSVWNKVFGPKYGCPSNGKNVGAEKIVSGETVPKARKFKS